METQYSAESVYRDHVETRRTLTQPLRFLILGRLVEPLRRLEIWELEEHEALGLPIALQHRELTAARDEAASAGCHRGGRGLLVELVLLRITDVSLNDDVRSHTDSFLTQDDRKTFTHGFGLPCPGVALWAQPRS